MSTNEELLNAINAVEGRLSSKIEAMEVRVRGDIENLTARVEDIEMRQRTASRIDAFRPLAFGPYQNDVLAATGSAFNEKHFNFRVPSPIAQ